MRWIKAKQVFDNASIQTSDIPKEAINKIKEIQKNIPKNILFTDYDDEWIIDGLQDFHHITILYGIKDEDIDRAKEIAKNYTPIKIECDKISYFDNSEDEGCYVLKLDCKSKELENLHNELKENLENEHRDNFHPHLTIAYLSEKLDTMPEIEPISFIIDEIEISKTDGTQEKIKLNKKISATEKKQFEVVWQSKHKIVVEAESEEDAIAIVELGDYDPDLMEEEIVSTPKAYKIRR